MTNPNETKPVRTNACPTCSAALNASVRITLYSVELEDGSIVSYEGGPQPESEADIIELCEADNTVILCEAGHILGATSPRSNPFQILELIANWPANSNSDPDIMGEALDDITALASEALRNVLPKQALRFKKDHGYNSTQTGDYYIFAGFRSGLYTFYRPFSGNGHRLTEEEAAACFDHKHSKGKANTSDTEAASDWHDSNVTI